MLWRKLVLMVSLIINIVFIYSLVWGQHGIISYRELRNTSIELEAQIDQLGKQNDDLQKQIELLQHDPKYQEKMIRSRWNFVKQNEILYIFPHSELESSGAAQDESKN